MDTQETNPAQQIITPTTATSATPGNEVAKPLIALTFLFIVAVIVWVVITIYKCWPGSHHQILYAPTIEQRFIVLVALGGALGALVHVASSFVAYLGNKQLTYSWLPWYFMRPLIGAVLALVFYFALRGGVITYTPVSEKSNTTDTTAQVTVTANSSSLQDTTAHTSSLIQASDIIQPKNNTTSEKENPLPFNPYGIMAISCLAGMFSKQASKKLQEVFDALFPVKEPDKLSNSLTDNS